MRFLNALEALVDEKAEGILPKGSALNGMYVLRGGDIMYCLDGVYYDAKISVDALLGEWALVNEIIRPKPGDIWKEEGGIPFFVLEGGSVICKNGLGTHEEYIDRYGVKHGEEWKRLYPPVGEEK